MVNLMHIVQTVSLRDKQQTAVHLQPIPFHAHA